jgi:hypothetical protein
MSEELTASEWDALRELSNGYGPQDENGIDLSLIDRNLKLTPTQRLIQHDRALQLVQLLRKAGRARGEFDAQSPATPR